jgi:hypothetical protein
VRAGQHGCQHRRPRRKWFGNALGLAGRGPQLPVQRKSGAP